jgi:hypothetical protein
VVPNLISWTSRPGESYEDLTEIYTEMLGQWSQYMGHVVTLVGGVYIDNKSTDQAGAVYTGVAKARQKAAVQFLAQHVFTTPDWLAPREILERVGPPAGTSALSNRQAAVLTQLFDARRLGRLQDQEILDAANAYPVSEYFADLKRAVWGAIGASPLPDAHRRALQRAYLERLEALVSPPAPAAAAGARAGGPPQPASTLLAPPNVQRSDIVALARAQLRQIVQESTRAATAATPGVMRAHWQDIADRAGRILNPNRN